MRLIQDDCAYSRYMAYNSMFLYLADENKSFEGKKKTKIPIYEFGVGSGKTSAQMQFIANLNNVDISEYWGFDSFEGLPELTNNELLRWSERAFKYNKELAYKRIKRWSKNNTKINVIASRFDQVEIELKPPSNHWIIHIDCDLYISTVGALFLTKDIIKSGGGLIIFDDYYSGLVENVKGEKKAFEEFCESDNVKAILWKRFSHNGAIFIVPKKIDLN